MMQTIDLRGQTLSTSQLRTVIPRPELDVTEALAGATQLIQEVREHGEEALLEQAERFDRVRPNAIPATGEAIDAAVEGLDPAVRSALEEMIRRVRLASAGQVPAPAITEVANGAIIEQRWEPVERVGLYVPGGKAVYPSSVVMNVVSAQVAGVKSIAIASPPQADYGGAIHPTILAAAGLLGVTEVYAMGGAGAIGAFAYGVETLGLEPVNVITGPGNVWVAAAKRAVTSVVGIDAEAGPTEVLIIADDNADPELIAADLLGQAEHDELAAAVLVTDSAELAAAVEPILARRTNATKHSERASTSLRGQQSAIVLVDNLTEAARVSNAYGPEHLQIQTADDNGVLELITSAGAIFVGPYAPVPLGDYIAGSNHVLPTGGQAIHASGLGAHTFLRAQQIIRYDREALDEVRDRLRVIATDEDLPAHGESVDARFGAGRDA
ncbi:histidinol dehydrogenase [Gulosibacter chungangensis]|uniref:Histidinol dehydrogenase n=1 Tax=Gulosibacter chungangensis TaxID=979746 RepID=A0A7J5BD74_9MICO|nr:histidinol dehydrogenase [Gulosibacter chungangensis]KAB1643992.1 histidinol dehydrogenase [Gulosibacter chungangensis]